MRLQNLLQKIRKGFIKYKTKNPCAMQTGFFSLVESFSVGFSSVVFSLCDSSLIYSKLVREFCQLFFTKFSTFPLTFYLHAYLHNMFYSNADL